MKRCKTCGKLHNCKGAECNKCSRFNYTLEQALATAALYMEFAAEETEISAYKKELLAQAEIIKWHARRVVATKEKLNS